MPKPNYGLDAPGVVRNFVLLSFGAAIVFCIDRFPRGLRHAGLCMAIWFAGTALVMVWSSYSGKFLVRDRLLNQIPWRGDEQVLDVGCGHGLMLLGAAKRLTAGGRAVGIDLWQSEDQAGNSPEATRRNAELEGVAERVDVRDGDARKLPFGDASFDVVVSSLAIHNIYDAAGREQAIAEVARVTKPGGHVAIVDIRHGAAYAKWLAARGFEIVASRTNLLFALPTRVLLARKAS